MSTIDKSSLVQNVVGGVYTSSSASTTLQILSPQTGECVAQIAISNADDVSSAVTEAKSAWLDWKGRSTKDRSLYLRKFLFLLSNFAKEVADLVVKESGRNIQEALGDVARAIEAVEGAASHSIQTGSRHLETPSGEYVNEKNLPLGVVASILSGCSSGTIVTVYFSHTIAARLTHYDVFTVLSVMWTVPIALVLGNCVILKPDPQTVLSTRRLTELFLAAGFPAGVLQVLHGDAETALALCEHTGVAAVAFVGTSQVAEKVVRRCQAGNKRVVAYGGAKNHVYVLPDCDVSGTARDVVEGFTGCAGQHALALSVLVLVTDGSEYGKKSLTETVLQEVISAAGKIEAGQKAGQMGPVATAADRDR
jgi:acyl-CoA reductase-like NAD-dependent aldehyde dehydrogenase